MAIEKSPETRPQLVSELDSRDPFQQWQVVNVQFPDDANTDYIIRHNLQVSNPRDIHYRVIKQFTGGSVYESVAPDSKDWTTSYIVLRSDFGGWTGRLLLGTLRKVSSFPVENYEIPETLPPVTSTKLGIACTIDGRGDILTTGVKNSVRVPFPCTITSVSVQSCDANPPTSGSIELEIKKGAFSSYPTCSSIVASAPPTITSDTDSFDDTLTGWTTTIDADDFLEFSITSVSGFTRITVVLGITE